MMLLALATGGCLSEPPLEERWTKLEIVEASPASMSELAGGGSAQFNVRARVTYRDIVTRSVVAELRASELAPQEGVELTGLDPRLEASQFVDRLLIEATPLGLSDRLVTGFDQLIQEFDLSFEATVPVPADSSHLYLILYMADVDEVEIEPGVETIVVDPLLTTEGEVLSAGIAL